MSNEVQDLPAQQMDTINQHNDDSDWDSIPTMEEAQADIESGDSDDWIEEATKSVETDDKANEEVQGDSKEESNSPDQADAEVRSEDTDEDSVLSGKDVEEDKGPEMISVKVDGEEQEVSLDDLKANYSGKVAYDKRFQELDKERQEYKAEVEEINNYVNTFSSKMQKESVLSGTQYLAELAGHAPHLVKQALIDELREEVYRQDGLSPEELQFEIQKNDVEYKEKKLESDNQAYTQKQASLALESEILKTQEAYGINRDQFDAYFKELDELLEPHEAITPEMVGNFAYEVQLDDRAVNILSEFEDRVEANDEVISNLVNYLKSNEGLSDNEVKEVIKAELEGLEKKEVEEDLEKVAKKKDVKQPSKSKKSDDLFEPIVNDDGLEIDDFDDL